MELFAVDCLLDESKNYLLDSLNVVHELPVFVRICKTYRKSVKSGD